MEFMGMSRMDAAWYTPAVTMQRLQMAHLENMGEEQNWGKSRLELIMEAEDAADGK